MIEWEESRVSVDLDATTKKESAAKMEEWNVKKPWKRGLEEGKRVG